ncbi:hypothetical protein ACN28E_32170 [Archangium lansingense]|uniref:hypothetical protein n=1 Tax=Archangium lansingense TaxID=2995310 RepID=UPI003B790D6C
MQLLAVTPNLVEYLAEHQIPLEVCPSSNVALHVCPGLEQHPLPKLMEAGLRLSPRGGWGALEGLRSLRADARRSRTSGTTKARAGQRSAHPLLELL